MSAFASATATSAASYDRPKKTRNGFLPPPIPNGHAGYHHDTFKPTTLPRRLHIGWRLRRMLMRPMVWLLLVILGLTIWWGRGGVTRELQSAEVQGRLRELFPPEITKNLQFFPASNHKIHYVGRWTAAPNRLRIDGAFPGVYFDLNVTNTSTILISLENAEPHPLATPLPNAEDGEHEEHHIPGISSSSQYSFSAGSRFRGGAAPVSLLALVDQDEYVILPNATSLVGVRVGDLDRKKSHSVRVVAPMTDNGGKGVVQVDGIWLSRGGQLLPVEGSLADATHEEMNDFDPESDMIGEKHRLGLSALLRGNHHDQTQALRNPTKQEAESESDALSAFRKRKKLVEVVTDNPAHLHGARDTKRTGGADGLLAGVMGWEFLLGEMFSIDHVSIAAEGMCLLQNCVEGTDSPNGLGDVFFRSGPVGSPHFGHPWPFHSYAPDVLIFNLGASDQYSINNHINEYNKTAAELFRQFEDTYVSLIKAVRSMAYPNHPATIEMQRLGVDAFSESNAPAMVPIFIMRPFLGELEHFTQGVVNRLRAEGDKGVFWLDTSGWLDFEGTESKESDFVKDRMSDPPRWHLTERGNQKVAIYLHMHVCRYLARADESCPFLPPEVYQGSVFDPSVATFERYIENEKERQMKELFWDHSEV